MRQAAEYKGETLDFGYIARSNAGHVNFWSWQTQLRDSTKPGKGKVITEAPVWAGDGEESLPNVTVLGKWDDAHEGRYQAIRKKKERDLDMQQGAHQEKLF